LLIILISLPAAAQGLYFDIGIGLGLAATEIDGVDVSSGLGSSVDEIGVEVGLKAGYGPIAGIPLYIVGEMSGVGHRFDDGVDYIQFNSYLLGPGIIIYPIPQIQLGSSIGYSFVANQSSSSLLSFYDSESGWAFNVYAAADFGRRNHGGLIGIKYTYASNKLEVSGANQVTTLASLFVKYAFRHK
jgi:hypothetical protein